MLSFLLQYYLFKGKMQLAFDNTVLKSSFQNDVSIDVENLSTGIVVALKGI